MFTCRLGVVPLLDCGVLIGHDCPLLMQFLRKIASMTQKGTTKVLQAQPREAKGHGVELLVYREDISQLTQEDPSLRFARALAQEQPSPATKKASTFLIHHGVFYRWVEGKTQLVVPGPL